MRATLFKATTPFLFIAATLPARLAEPAPPHDTLLPDSTAVYLHAPSLPQLDQELNDSQFGKILAADNMDAFRHELRRFVDDKLQAYTQTTGLTLRDLVDFAAAGVTVAVVPGKDDRPVYLVLADANGREDVAQQLITEAGRRLHAAGAIGAVRQAGPIQFVAYHAAFEDDESREAAFLLHDGVLAISTGANAMDDLARRWNGGGANSLAEREAFRQVMAACHREPGDGLAAGTAFVDPVQTIRVFHAADGSRLDKRDPLEFLSKHGIDAIRGVGGVLNMATDVTDLTLRLAVHAPGPHRGALKMVCLPPCQQFAPPDWLTDDVNLFAAISVDLTAVLDSIGPIFDDVVGDGVEGTFDDILRDLRADDGPQVDVREDLVAHLGPNVWIVSDQPAQDDPGSERSLVAIESADDAAVALAIKKLLRDDPGVRRFRLAAMANDLWEIGEESGGLGGEPTLSNSAVMVANGHVLLATNTHLVRKLLEEARSEGRKLEAAEDLKRLETCLARYTPRETVGRVYSRTSRDIRATYELLRLGGERPSESIYGMLIGKLLAAMRDPRTGELPIDFTTLPPFDEVANRLGWIGLTGKNLNHGWYIVAIALPPK